MKYQDLIKVKDTGKEVPDQGYMLAYLIKEVVFKVYYSLQEVEKQLAGQEILELHLFNRQKEYRAVSSVSKRFPSGVIEWVSDFPEEGAYCELVYLEKQDEDVGVKRIEILNHIGDSQETNGGQKAGMVRVDDYRIRVEA